MVKELLFVILLRKVPTCEHLFLVQIFYFWDIFGDTIYEKSLTECSARHFSGKDEIPPACGRRYLGPPAGALATIGSPRPSVVRTFLPFRPRSSKLGSSEPTKKAQRICAGLPLVAERTRFELVVRNDPYVGLANRWFQPLTHLSSHCWRVRMDPEFQVGLQIYEII